VRSAAILTFNRRFDEEVRMERSRALGIAATCAVAGAAAAVAIGAMFGLFGTTNADADRAGDFQPSLVLESTTTTAVPQPPQIITIDEPTPLAVPAPPSATAGTAPPVTSQIDGQRPADAAHPEEDTQEHAGAPQESPHEDDAAATSTTVTTVHEPEHEGEHAGEPDD
jgi:hypothetical protein